MRRVKLLLEYDGTEFAGFQQQAQGERTVQGVLEAALARIPGTRPKVTAAGRTDSGVHALAMPVHYDTEDTVPVDKVPLALNALLPPDVRVLEAEEVPPDWHARYSARWRRYLYRVQGRSQPTALDRHRVWWLPQPLDFSAIAAAAELLVGEHDFGAFANREKRATVRRLHQAHVEASGGELRLHFVGSGFVRGQVRSMVGTLVEVGLGRRPPEDVARLLAHPERSEGGATAPPQGLYFVAAGYSPWAEGAA
ncbi:MAG TPA: tRNA pseudouridine(38-40) synthase TruA [Oceanithermus profundus]|uniref:tRNA pseudouridine synthase A n=1 Tax=Oceanithermus profundus TaxID=187137 RepID=A0A7C4ZG83_9DEIN|nr:tRNA pseudouridine(38-40) synthase TruA [Oceanithermus profundus]